MYLKDKKAEILSGFVTVFENVPDYLIKEICQWDRDNPTIYSSSLNNTIDALIANLKARFENIEINVYADDKFVISCKPQITTETIKIDDCKYCRFSFKILDNYLCCFYGKEIGKLLNKPDFCKLTEITTVEENY